MSKEYRKVRFVKNFREEWVKGVAKDEKISEKRVEILYLSGVSYVSFGELEKRVAGNIGRVNHEGGNHYFEQVDNNWSIPRNCFEYI